MEQKRPSEKLEKILVIRSYPVSSDPFSALPEVVRISDITQPIEDQIAWADLVITLGRGALESMAQSRSLSPITGNISGPWVMGTSHGKTLQRLQSTTFQGVGSSVLRPNGWRQSLENIALTILILFMVIFAITMLRKK